MATIEDLERVKKLSGVASRLDTHEAVCAERYVAIDKRFDAVDTRLGRLEFIMISTAGATLLLLSGVLLSILFKVN